MSDNGSPPLPQEQKRDAPKREPASECGLYPPSDEHPVTRRPHSLDPNAPPSSQPSASTLRPEGSTESISTTKASTTGFLAVARGAPLCAGELNGVDIRLLAPVSGKDGRVERMDVERYRASGKSVGEQPINSDTESGHLPRHPPIQNARQICNSFTNHALITTGSA
ncbi:hypothetical protein BJV74DRAFT_851121 [Russula compacta]|nr:hypothetical protein BJV74DRAFT_851121 [Russula compacta]